MFRRSLQILLAATLLALAAVIGYALTFPGAPETLARAEQMVQRKEYARAIAELDLCERGRSLQQDPALRDRLWRLRLAANKALENHRGALLDVDNLLREGGAERLDLQLERIDLLTAIGDGERARQLAREFTTDHPDDGRGLELAAAACAAAYRPTFTTLQDAVAHDVGTGQTEAALAAFASYVFRPDGDAEVAQSADQLAHMYSLDARLAARWAMLLRDLRSLRDQVQEGLGFCRRSLATAHVASTALATWASALDAGGRTDDMLMACEIQRRRSDDDASIGAAATSVLALLRGHRDAAALATAVRWLPQNQLQPRIDAGTLGPATADLLLGRVIAAWRLGDEMALRRALQDLTVWKQSGANTPIPLHTAAGMVHFLRQASTDSPADSKAADNNLRYVISLLTARPRDPAWPDLLELLVPLRLTLMRKLGTPEADVLALYDTWQTARPTSLLPRLAFARYLLAARKLPAAQAVLAEAAAGQPPDEELFGLQLEVARADESQPGQSGAALVAQCRQRRTSVPEVTNPIGYLLCAEAALQARSWRIARDSAEAGVAAFPQLRAPRLLAIEAMLGNGENEAAAQQTRRLLDLFPHDAATAALTLRAHRAAGLPTAPLLATLLPTCPPSAEVRTEVLRAALAEPPGAALPFAVGVLQDSTAPATLRLLAGRALADADRPADCRRLLESVLAESDALPAGTRLDLLHTFTAWIQAAAPYRADELLVGDVDHLLAHTDVRDADAAPMLLATAEKLRNTRPAAAYELVVHALPIAAPAARSGAAYALAGRLACHLRQLHIAEERWLAAMAFADGRPAAEDLARLLLAQGRADRALQVYDLLPQATDAALAARCGHPDQAAALAATAVAQDGADLLAQATLAALGKAGERDPGRSDWQVTDAPATELRLDVLALLGDPDLGPEALTRARQLAAAEPTSTTTQLLLARACLHAGLPADAARLHLAQRAQAPGPLLWREIAHAAAVPGYVLDPQLDGDVRGSLVGQTTAGSPLTLAFATGLVVRTLQQGGYTDLAQSMQQSLWVQLPRATVHTDADVEAVAALSNGRDAWFVLSQAMAALPASTRALARTRLYELANRLLTERGPEAKDVYELAWHHLQSEGPHGCIVHCLLDHGDQLPALRPDAAQTRAMLLAQIELAAAGADAGPWLQRSVDRLLASNGAAATRADLEAALQRHPTSLLLWHARATVMTHLRAGAEGIGDLWGVLAHAAAPEALRECLTLAAVAGVLTDRDAGRLTELPQALLAGPDGEFVRGLCALRTGRPDEAVTLLTNAPARADGAHLYALALAQLQSRALDGTARARDLLLRLAADYPSSSLARHAGSFAAQLAPR